jgi:ABC-2 type transport system permease protein
VPTRSQILAITRIYARLAATEFRRYSTYRMAVLAGVFTNSVFGFIRISVLGAAITAAGTSIAGYSVKEASTYVWLGQAYIAPLAIMGGMELADRVKNGDIAVDLARPVDLQASWWARDVGRAAFALLSRGLLPLVIGGVTVGLQLPTTWTAYPLGVLSLLIAVSISFTLRFIVNLTAFWVLDIRGFLSLYFVAIGLLSGFLVPVHFFPPWLATIAYATPAPSLLQLPIDVMSGRVVGGAALTTLAIQAAWLAGMVALARLVQRAAARRLVVQGG